MNRPVDERQFESGVRRMLSERRPAGGVPVTLATDVQQIPDVTQHGWSQMGPRLAGLAAALAVLTVLVGALLLFDPATPGNAPSQPSATPPPAFDPTVSGPGVVSDVAHTLGYIPWVLAVVALIVLASVALAVRSRIVAAVAGVLALIVLASAVWLTGHPGFTFGFAWGPLQAIEVVHAPAASDGPDVFYITALPGEPFGVVFNVTNPGPLPIQLLGVVEHPRWAALWIYPNTEGGVPGLEAAQPFEPIVVQPGEYTALYLVGRAGMCSAGPSFDPDSLSFVSFGHPVPIAYSVLGLNAVGDVETPFVIAEPQAEECPAPGD